MEKAVDGDYSLMHLDYTACGSGVDLEKFAPLKKPVSYSGTRRPQWYL